MRHHAHPSHLLLTIALATALTTPALAAKKDKTKGLPPARGNNVPEVNDQPMKDAKVNLAQAQGKVERAQDALTKLLADLHKQAEASPDVTQAQADLRQAQADYDAATAPILAKVRASRAYESAAEAKKAAAQHVIDLQADNAVRQDEITQAARVVLEKGKAVTDLETTAVADDKNATALKAKLAAANVKLLKLKHDLEQSIKTNPQVVAARKDVEQAQSEVPPLQSAYNSELEKYNTASAAREKALSAPGDRPGYDSGGGDKKMKKKKV